MPASRRSFQVPVEHQVAGANRLRRHDMNAKHAGEIREQRFRYFAAENQVMLNSEARDDGRHDIAVSRGRDRISVAKLLADEPLHPGLGDQVEPKLARRDPSDLFKAATGLSGNRDQSHAVSP